MEQTAGMGTGQTAPTAMGPTEPMATEPMARAPTGTGRTEPTATAPTASRAPISGFTNLERLVGLDAAAEFLASHFGRDAFRRRLPEGEAARLFSWDLLNQAIAEHRLGPPRLKLEKGGAEVGRAVFRERRPRPSQVIYDIDTPALYEHLRDGATLILDAVNELHSPLQRLCAGLASELCAYSQTNLYACWGQTQGFDVHWDEHDVFVVQIAGAKRWDLYGFTQPAPLRRASREKLSPPTQAPEPCVLEAGDVLYLPRGYWHAAIGLGEPSLHLTIGLSRKTGADLLHWLADEATADPDVRADLRLEQSDAVLGEQIAQMLRSLSALGDPAELGRRFRRQAEARRSHRPQLSFPDIGLEHEVIADQRRLRLTDGATALQVGDAPPAVQLSHRGVIYTLAPELEPVLMALYTGRSLTYGEMFSMSGVAPSLLERFVRDMLRRAVFVFEPRR